ncbi:ABC transporter permease [Wolbachia endosymbiont of Pentidionis agamae]|uniref:ABC transporter permease n=1 Tax=Wolbachia endosymbiont of Pentidionis agamae TaxID=3110435 RepID=UPI002FD0F674
MLLKILKNIFLFLIAILFICPIVSLVSILFTDAATSPWIISRLFPEYIFNTIILMVGVGIITFIFGVIPAWLITFFSFPGRKILEVVLFFPISIPGYISAFIYANTLEFSGPVQTLLREIFHWSKNDYWFPEIKSLGSGMLVMGFSLYPYVYILVRSNLKKLSNSVTISSTFGYSPLHNLFAIIIPSARPSIIAGLSLVLMEVITDFGSSQFLAIDTFTTGIYRTWFLLYDKYLATVLAIIGLLFILVLTILEKKFQKRGDSCLSLNVNLDYHSKREIKSITHLIFTYTMCILPVLIGFIIPIIPLIYWTIEKSFHIYDFRFYATLINSITISSMTALISIILAIIIGYVAQKDKIMRYLAHIISMGYSVPNIIIAISIMIFLGQVSLVISNYITKVYLVGTVIALIYSYIFCFFAISFKAVESGLKKVSKEIEWTASTMGYGPISTCVNIHVPLIRKSILAGFLLVFIDTLKELTITLIIRPFNFETLSTRIYELVSDERYKEAAPFALIIIVIGLVAAVLLSNFDDEK